jgi:hypothetical protein
MFYLSYAGVKHDFHIIRCSRCATVIRLVPWCQQCLPFRVHSLYSIKFNIYLKIQQSDRNFVVLKRALVVYVLSSGYWWISVFMPVVKLCLSWVRQTEHIRGHLWYRYSTMVKSWWRSQNRWSDDFNLTTRNHWFSNILVSRNNILLEIVFDTSIT